MSITVKFLPDVSPSLIQYRNLRCSFLLEWCIRDKLLPIGATLDEAFQQSNSSYKDVIDDIAQLDKLLSDDRMNNVWKTLSKYDVDHFCFYMAAASALSLPKNKEDRKTAKERNDWLSDVSATAEKLSSLLHGSRFDEVLLEDHIERFEHNKSIIDQRASVSGGKVENIKAYDLTEFRAVWYSLGADQLSEVLSRLAQIAARPDGGLPPALLLKKPQAKRSSRRLFIAKLTAFLVENAGSPLRRVVAEMVSVVFEVDDFTEKDVRDYLDGVVNSRD